MSNAALLAELTRVKVLFQARTLALIIGVPADDVALHLPQNSESQGANAGGDGVSEIIHSGWSF